MATKVSTRPSPSPPQAFDLGELLLSEETQQLRGVEVRGRRPIITRQADRLVFDAQQISAGAQNALDVLKRTPGLNVTDDGISIIGRGKAIILINDKRVRLSGEASRVLLRSYSQSAHRRSTGTHHPTSQV